MRHGKAKKIGEINVPANAAQEVTQFTVNVASAVDNLDGKHAIFLVAEGSCDIIGLGFSSDKKKIVRPVPPSVSIKVNGVDIQLPATPVRSTNANGITDVTLYQAAYTVPADVTGIPQVTASASDSKVKVDIKQAESRDGTAVVKFDNNGLVKTYNVVLR